MRIERDIKLDYNDVLIRPKRSTMNSRCEVDLCRTYTFLNSGITYTGVPVMASNMHGVGTFAMADALTPMNLFTVLCKDYVGGEVHFWHANSDIKGELCNHVAISTGITDADWERTAQTLKLNRSLNYLCVDVANGYSERFLDAVSKYRDEYPDITIIAGNVVTPDITEELILRGADIVKVGIGNGSVCTTRIKTGVGYPQLSAVIECADAAHGLGGHIIADGGCTTPGDIAKAFGAGADFVMLGGMLAGTDQGGGDITSKYLNPNSEYFFAKHTESYHPVVQQQDYVQFYGMSSKAAQGDSFQDYRSSEGRIVTVPYRGPVHHIAKDILGGLRSACTYVGARSLKELSKRTTFVQVNRTHNDVYESVTVGE